MARWQKILSKMSINAFYFSLNSYFCKQMLFFVLLEGELTYSDLIEQWAMAPLNLACLFCFMLASR